MTDEDLEAVLIRSIIWGSSPHMFDPRLFMLAAIDAERKGITLWWYMLRPLFWMTVIAAPFIAYILYILWLEGKL